MPLSEGRPMSQTWAAAPKEIYDLFRSREKPRLAAANTTIAASNPTPKACVTGTCI
jgi:hypothetical protein